MTIKQMVDSILMKFPGMGQTQAMVELFDAERTFISETKCVNIWETVKVEDLTETDDGWLRWTPEEDMIGVLDIEYYGARGRLSDIYARVVRDDIVDFITPMPGVIHIALRYYFYPDYGDESIKSLFTPSQFHRGVLASIEARHYGPLGQRFLVRKLESEYRQHVVRAIQFTNRDADRANMTIQQHSY